MVSRRAFLRMTSAAGTAAYALKTYGLEEVLAASAQVAGRSADGCGAGRVLLARDPARLHARSHADQSQQRQQLPQPHRRARRAEAVPRLHEPGAGVLPRAARTEQRNGAPSAGRRVRLRQRRARHHAQFQRSAADRAERARSQAGRRSADDRAGLRPHVDHLGSAGTPREDQDHADQLSGADDAGRSVSAVRESHHTADQGPALLPHHEPHRAALPGQAPEPDGARSAASSPSSMARTRLRTSRSSWPISSATTTAPACTSGCWRRTTPASCMCDAIGSRRRGR